MVRKRVSSYGVHLGMSANKGRWGRGFRMGNMCTPVEDSCWCMTKPTQYCKVKKKKKSIQWNSLSLAQGPEIIDSHEHYTCA